MVVDSRSLPNIALRDAHAHEKDTYKPSVDITFNSLSQIYGGDTLAVILTGMGADGREGCRTLKSLGAKIWAQDKDSSVVYGMPQAVTVDRLAEVNIDINDIGECIKTEMS